jgi:hypothetical protein
MCQLQNEGRRLEFKIANLAVVYLTAVFFAVFIAWITEGACGIVANFQKGVYHTPENKIWSIIIWISASMYVLVSGIYSDIRFSKIAGWKFHFLENTPSQSAVSLHIFNYIAVKKRIFLIYPILLSVNILAGLGLLCLINTD